jgi:hypothetical protein
METADGDVLASQETDDFDLDNLDTGISAMLGAAGNVADGSGKAKSKAAKGKAANSKTQQKGAKVLKAAKAPATSVHAQGPGASKASSTTPRPVAACTFWDSSKLKLVFEQWQEQLQADAAVKTGQGKKTTQEVFTADAKFLSESLKKLLDAVSSRQPDSFEEDALLEYAREQRSLVAAQLPYNDPFVIAR